MVNENHPTLDRRAKTRQPNEVTAFQKRWASFQDFADGASVSYGLAQQWRHRNSIPAEYDFAIATDAARRGVGAFDAILAELAKMRART